MKLSIELSKWRCDRPDEWKMDEFIRNAEKLEADRDSLVAQVEVLRIAALNAVQRMSGGEAKADLRDAYDATPEQCLAEIKAQAVIDAIDAHKNNLMTFDFDTAIRTTDLIKYANQLRAKAKP